MAAHPSPFTRHIISGPERPQATARGLAAVVLGGTALICVLFVALALPGVKSGLHEVPVGVTGAPAATARLAGALEQARPGAFDVTRYASPQELEEAIEQRDVYGGILVGGDERVLVASGGSAVVAQALGEVAQSPLLRAGDPTPVVDIAPLPETDPRGSGIAGLALPLSIGAAIPALLLLLRFPERRSVRLLGAALFAVVAGLSIAAILDAWFGTTEENFLLVSAGLALGIAAVTLFVHGLATWLGLAGFGLGLLFMMLVANPLSGLATAPEFLPAGWGAFGQWLPTGASGTLLRSNAYFDGNAATGPVLVLAGWIVVGLVLAFLPPLRRRPGAA